MNELNIPELEPSTDTAIDYSTCYAQPSIQLFNCDNLELMAKMEDNSVDVILTDPPYLYLKNQKLERPFDGQLFFSECKRLLTKNGFIVMFGSGKSFYRWNTMLEDLGFNFKEEIIWDKSYCTSPLMAISRVHETISIHSKGKGTINKVKIPYLEMKSHNLDSVIQDVKRIKGALNNTKSLNNMIEFLKNNADNNSIIPNRNDWNGKISKNEVTASNGSAESGDRSVNYLQTIEFGLNEKTIIRADYGKRTNKNMITYSDKIKDGDRSVNCLNSIEFGLNEKSIIRTDRYVYKNNSVVGLKEITKPNRAVSVMQSIDNGMTEKTIIKEVRDHYSAIHPTQKPVRLLERLLSLVIPGDKNKEDIIVFDPFGGSFSTMEAVYNMNLKGISCEIDKEFFEAGKKRVDSLIQQPKLF